jgi:ATP-dependent Clp protease ATP-binding subunit ClpC
MFERFTDKARKVVMHAQEEARSLDHNYIGTEHLLLGLLIEEEGLASKVLTEFELTVDKVRSEIERRIGRGSEATKGHIPFTPRAKKVLELSLRQALRLQHNYIGTEHILLGLITEGEGVAAQILETEAEGGMSAVEAAVVEALGPEAIEAARRPLEGIGRRISERLRGGMHLTASAAGDDEVRKRLEAIEARLSAIEQLLRRQSGEEEVS